MGRRRAPVAAVRFGIVYFVRAYVLWDVAMVTRADTDPASVITAAGSDAINADFDPIGT